RTADVSFTSSRRIDVDEGTGQSDEINVRVQFLSPVAHRIHASSSVRVSVLESRYLTMTGVESDRPHSTPLAAVTRRAPGTTTARSGTMSGRSEVGSMIRPRTRSYTRVEPVKTVPAAMTARALIMAPSYTPVLPPINTSSSTITGRAPT